MEELINNNKSFLGTGWSFPPSFDYKNHRVGMSSNEVDIEESLFILLSTTPGERVMRPEFGCDLQSVVFRNINSETKAMVRDMIRGAILYFEPRITLDDVELIDTHAKEGFLNIILHYTIRTINVRSNIVYPFYT